MADGGRYTIDELAAHTGVPSRTIRFYQAKGMLMPPRREGRIAVYGDEHVERLRLVGELQDRGVGLRAIRELVERMGRGDVSVGEWLGFGEQLQRPWSDDAPHVIGDAELGELMGPSPRPGLVADLVRTGVIQRQGDARPARYLVPSGRLLRLSLNLDSHGVDVGTAHGAEQILRKQLGKAADELVAFFKERAGRGFGSSDRPEAIAEALGALRSTAVEAVTLVFAQEIERAVRQFVEGKKT